MLTRKPFTYFKLFCFISDHKNNVCILMKIGSATAEEFRAATPHPRQTTLKNKKYLQRENSVQLFGHETKPKSIHSSQLNNEPQRKGVF